ncbi:MAG: flagellar motor protein MotB [Alphaproteobacteria bacterium]|nr:flagellar motor protein MotB [Alphaproteobacteria bacterium]
MNIRQLSRNRRNEYTAGNAWMLTFADLLSLLLTFFVLVFSMNTIQYENWEAVVQSMSDQFNPNRPHISQEENDSDDSQLKARQRGLNLSYLEAVLKRSFSQIPLFQSGEIWRADDKIIVSIPASLLFERKDALLQPEAVKALQLLAGVLVQLRNKVQISGHTDSAPITSRLYRSNWELSVTRARVVAGVLAEGGFRDPVAVLGFADTRFEQLAPELTLERRYDLAERIDITIIDERRDRGLYDIF